MAYILIGIALCSGCTSVISTPVLEQVNEDIRFVDLQRNPEVYQGQTVIVAGVIVGTAYESDVKTILEAYQTRMNFEKRPVNLDVSQGRFLAEYDGFLDSEIYKKGREVTVAGVVQGLKVMKLGETEYRYPYLRIKEIHLWEKREPRVYDPYPWYPVGRPWGAWGGWYGPYWAD
jgi:outer membrane lipoprotein